jgi:hypothetical protein
MLSWVTNADIASTDRTERFRNTLLLMKPPGSCWAAVSIDTPASADLLPAREAVIAKARAAR